MIKYVIGIDPGKQTGFALWEKADRVLTLWTFDFHLTLYKIEQLLELISCDQILANIEVPNKHVWQHEKGAYNVGRCTREAELLAGEIERRGIRVNRISPKQKGPKLDHQKFCRKTGYKQQTNQHTRDAGMLAWGY